VALPSVELSRVCNRYVSPRERACGALEGSRFGALGERGCIVALLQLCLSMGECWLDSLRRLSGFIGVNDRCETLRC
jgi:hypothetical protein